MAATHGELAARQGSRSSPGSLDGPRVRWTSGPIAELLAPVVLCVYVVLAFEPLVNLLPLAIPGFVSSVLFPGFGMGVNTLRSLGG